ncbi:MAG: hypothetical protein JRG79_16935 [Deltaproteobacteria bacterium]|nr:hypothetical protein [Deltaproteobacteria bacterium]
MAMDPEQYQSLTAFIEKWEKDSSRVKDVFEQLHEKLHNKEYTTLSFKARPGVSYSLRANRWVGDDQDPQLYALIDVIDDDPENRWLSVCFYDGTVSDPEQLGNLIPQGILGDDGYCFDVNEKDETLTLFLGQKIDEAFENIERPKTS